MAILKFLCMSFMSLLLVSSYIGQATAYFFIAREIANHGYTSGDTFFCSAGETDYYLFSSPEPPAACQGCGCGTFDYEGHAGTSIGNCGYGDYNGKAGAWAFCPTGYGGNLYLAANQGHKVCNTVDPPMGVSQCSDGFCTSYYEAVIVCWDDTWYFG